MKRLIIISLSILLIVLVGCTYYDTSNVPFCEDINVTGIECHSPDDIDIWGVDNGDWNYSKSICKETYFSATGHNEMKFCFDTLEDSMFELAEKFKKCWNCPEENECGSAGDCSDNMSLEGCSYDGCNYCCGNQCTVMMCLDEDKINWPDINLDEIEWAFGGTPRSVDIPDDYKAITIYETICGCSMYPCTDYYRYCYNQSRIIWVRNE